MKSRLSDTRCWYVLWHDFIIANKNHNGHPNNIHNLQSSFDSILIVLYSTMMLSEIFNSSLIIENVLDIQSFFSILAFHINDIDHDFSAFSLMLHIFLYNTIKMTINTICIYCHFNCYRTKFIDIMCICHDLFLWPCQYTQQNVPKSSNALRMTDIKTTRTNNYASCPNKQEYCIWKIIHIKNHNKNENHVKKAWKSRWIPIFTKVVPQCPHSLLILCMFVNLSFQDFLFL